MTEQPSPELETEDSPTTDVVADGGGGPVSADAPPDLRVCPFCGAARAFATGDVVCPRCTMPDTPGSRRATRQRIGPWYVLQSRNPAAPGMRFDVLLGFVRKGQVTRRSIVRGPTTKQFWQQAATVRGLSREFGVCWSCGQGVESFAASCEACGSSQTLPDDPDALVEPDGNGAVAAGPALPKPIYRNLPPPAAPDARAAPRTPAAPGGRRPDDVLMSVNDLADTFHLADGPVDLAGERSARGWVVALLVLFVLALATLAVAAVLVVR